MRKFLALILAALLALTLVACDGGSSSSNPVSENSESNTTSTTENKTTEQAELTTTSGRRPTSATTASTTAAFDGYYATADEKPYTGNAATLYNGQTSRFDAQGEAKRQAILNLADTVKASAGGTTYYISPKGNDENAGTSKGKAWRTTKNLTDTTKFKAGDAVLFERGGVYRSVSFHVVSGVSYGAYGTGAKPALYGSPRNYADETLWKKTSTANVWRMKVEKDTNDIGNLVFDHGKQFTLKMPVNKLTVEFQMYHDAGNDYVYLYHSAGNPGKVYSDIEICAKNNMIYAKAQSTVENVTIENLCLKYTGAHGIAFQSGSNTSNKNITIRGCEIGWIGGSMLDRSARYGNGIEFNGWINGAEVYDNWIYQCYDAGYTNQGSNCYQENLTIRENLIEYNPYNIEVWTEKEIGKGGMNDCAFKDNLLRFAGYGWGTLARLGSTTKMIGNISFYDYTIPCKNVIISGNIFDCSYRYLVSLAYPNDTQGRGPTIKGNTWNQKPYKNDDTTAAVNQLKLDGPDQYATTLHCKDQAEMEASVKLTDTAPLGISLEK